MSISNSTLMSCVSGSDGGAIFASFANVLTIVASTLSNNIARSGSGGAIAVSSLNTDVVININQTTFNANVASNYGGCVAFQQQIPNSFSLVDCLFSYNQV